MLKDTLTHPDGKWAYFCRWTSCEYIAPAAIRSFPASQIKFFRTLCIPVYWDRADNVRDPTQRTLTRMLSKAAPGHCNHSPPHLIRCVVFGSLEISKDMFRQNCIFTAWPFGTLIPLPCPSSCTKIGFCLGVYTSPSIAAALFVFGCWAELYRATNGMAWWQ